MKKQNKYEIFHCFCPHCIMFIYFASYNFAYQSNQSELRCPECDQEYRPCDLILMHREELEVIIDLFIKRKAIFCRKIKEQKVDKILTAIINAEFSQPLLE